MKNSIASKDLAKMSPFLKPVKIGAKADIHPNTVINYFTDPKQKDTFLKVYRISFDQFTKLKEAINKIDPIHPDDIQL